MWLANIFRPMQIVLTAIDNKDSKAALYVAVLVSGRRQHEVVYTSTLVYILYRQQVDNKYLNHA